MWILLRHNHMRHWTASAGSQLGQEGHICTKSANLKDLKVLMEIPTDLEIKPDGLLSNLFGCFVLISTTEACKRSFLIQGTRKHSQEHIKENPKNIKHDKTGYSRSWFLFGNSNFEHVDCLSHVFHYFTIWLTCPCYTANNQSALLWIILPG